MLFTAAETGNPEGLSATNRIVFDFHTTQRMAGDKIQTLRVLKTNTAITQDDVDLRMLEVRLLLDKLEALASEFQQEQRRALVIEDDSQFVPLIISHPLVWAIFSTTLKNATGALPVGVVYNR